MTVYGYIREQYGLDAVPDDIKDICVKFYLRVYDKWNVAKSSQVFNIDADTGIISAEYISNADQGYHDAFGSLVIESGHIQKWEIKQLHYLYNKNLEFYVGIVDESKIDEDMKGFCAVRNEAGI